MQKLISFEEGGAAVHVTDLLQLAEQMVVAFGPQQGTECMDTFKLRPEITLNLDHHLNTLSDLFLFHFAHDTSLALWSFLYLNSSSKIYREAQHLEKLK